VRITKKASLCCWLLTFKLRLQLCHLCLRLLQYKIQLHRTLHQQVAGVRLLGQGLSNQCLGFWFFRANLRLRQLREKRIQHVTFLSIHVQTSSMQLLVSIRPSIGVEVQLKRSRKQKIAPQPNNVKEAIDLILRFKP
jgi:hypothetical protein